METQKKKTNEIEKEKIGQIPAEEIKGSDADLAYPEKKDTEKQAKQNEGSDADTDPSSPLGDFIN